MLQIKRVKHLNSSSPSCFMLTWPPTSAPVCGYLSKTENSSVSDFYIFPVAGSLALIINHFFLQFWMKISRSTATRVSSDPPSPSKQKKRLTGLSGDWEQQLSRFTFQLHGGNKLVFSELMKTMFLCVGNIKWLIISADFYYFMNTAEQKWDCVIFPSH